MRSNHVNKNSIQLRCEDIEDVEQFTYLGSVVSGDGGTDRDIKSRIGKATAETQVISVKTKLRIFNTNVKSVLLYDCEKRTGQNHKRRNLEKNRTSTSRIPNQEKMWDWLGHALRMSSVVPHALKWNPQGKRKRGRPRSTWRRFVETEGRILGHSWGQLEVLSRDRAKWRKFVVDLCSTRDTLV